ncbi:MAG: ThiF family adenylyltransferase [Crenarchaeota archaeon]|nr:ThiF family adenylyltransferase [Thermoproteota archaeon]
MRRSVLVVGCGGLGSWTSLIMAKSGWKDFILVDPDYVEPKNISNQIYFPEDVGKPKVEALKRKLQDLGAKVETYQSRIEEVLDRLPEVPLALALTDNIPSRLVVEEKYKTLHAMVRPGFGIVTMTTENFKLSQVMREGRHEGPQEPPMVVMVASVAAREALSYLKEGKSKVEGKLLMISPYRFEVLEVGTA